VGSHDASCGVANGAARVVLCVRFTRSRSAHSRLVSTDLVAANNAAAYPEEEA